MSRLMYIADSWTDREQLTTHLGQELMSGRLAIVLGAGVSKPMNLPDWDELLDRMFTTAGLDRPTAKEPKRQAEFFLDAACKGDRQLLIRAVHQALYAAVRSSISIMRRNDTLAAIGALVMASKRGSAAFVVTFNYDDLLERYLEFHGFVTTSVTSTRHWASSADVVIFHPHGFIPLTDDRPASEDIVLDLTSYTKIIGNEADPWRQELLTLLRTHTCLFIGISGDDDNMDSLLFRAHGEHAIQSDGLPFWGVRFSTDTSAVDTAYWGKRGLKNFPVRDYHDDLPNFLFEVCQAAAVARVGR